MVMEWWPVFLGWPALLAALALGGFGTFNNRPWNLYVAALLISPFSLYLAATPRLSIFGLLPSLAFIGAGLALRWQKPNLAWALIFAVIAFFTWLIFAINVSPG